MAQSKRSLITDDEFREKVSLRAYRIYEDRGGQHGRDIDDWLQAENEVLSEAAPGKGPAAARKPPATSSAAAGHRTTKATRKTNSAS